jgi:hypothetical protein
MKRYMQQDVFDSLVIVRAMVDLTGDDRIFYDLIKRYVAMYPNEHAQMLAEDVDDAVVTAWEITKLIVQLRPSECHKDETAQLYLVFERLSEVMKKNAEPPPRGRIPGGSLFNSRSTPLPDRVGSCRKHLGLACQELLSNAV